MKKFIYKNLDTGEEFIVQHFDVLEADKIFLNRFNLKSKFPPAPWVLKVKKVG